MSNGRLVTDDNRTGYLVPGKGYIVPDDKEQELDDTGHENNMLHSA